MHFLQFFSRSTLAAINKSPLQYVLKTCYVAATPKRKPSTTPADTLDRSSLCLPTEHCCSPVRRAKKIFGWIKDPVERQQAKKDLLPEYYEYYDDSVCDKCNAASSASDIWF